MDTTTMHIVVKQGLDKSSALELPAFLPEEIDLWINMASRKFAKTRYSGFNPKTQSFEETQKRIDDLRTLVKTYSPGSLTDGTSTYPDSAYCTLPIPNSNVGDEDYWFTIQEEAEITVSGTTSRVGITECTFDEYRQKLDDPYSEHILHYGTAKPLRLFQSNTVYLIDDGNYTVSDYFLTYLKKPQEVDITTITSGNIVEDVYYGVYSTSSSAYVTYDGETYYTGGIFLGVSGTTTFSTTGTCVVTTATDMPEHTHDEIVNMAVNMMLENIEQPRYKTHMAEIATME